jgi:putative phosphoesterase
MRVAIISDTHVPSRAAEIPAFVEEEVRAADHTIHVGDFDTPEAYEEVSELASEAGTASERRAAESFETAEPSRDDERREASVEPPRATGDEFTAVKGNMDPESLGLPESVTLEFDGVTFVAIHGTGPTDIDGYFDLVAETTREEGGPDAIALCGHTHELMDVEERGVRVLNPGSATGADPADEATMMVAEIDDGDLDVTVKRK